MRIKSELKILLSKLRGYENPDPKLEQYPTDPEVASEILALAHVNGDVEKKKVVDLGCGTGILGIGAAVLGASVVGVDVDAAAIKVARENVRFVERELKKTLNVRFVVKEVSAVNSRADTVVMNPPFGIQKRDANLIFVRKALEASKKVYALLFLPDQKTEQYLRRYVEGLNAEITYVRRMRMGLKRSLWFHKRRIHRIQVALCVMRVT